MDKNLRKKHSTRYVIWLVLVMSMVLMLPATALAAVDQDVIIYGGWNTWDLHNPIVTPDEMIINIGESPKTIDFDAVAPHEMQIYGEIFLTGVTEFVYINSINVHLEYEESPDTWIPYVGRDGNDVIVPVVNESTQETYFKIDAYPTDISNYDIVKLPNDFRWRTEIIGVDDGDSFTINDFAGEDWEGS